MGSIIALIFCHCKVIFYLLDESYSHLGSGLLHYYRFNLPEGSIYMQKLVYHVASTLAMIDDTM